MDCRKVKVFLVQSLHGPRFVAVKFNQQQEQLQKNASSSLDCAALSISCSCPVKGTYGNCFAIVIEVTDTAVSILNGGVSDTFSFLLLEATYLLYFPLWKNSKITRSAIMSEKSVFQKMCLLIKKVLEANRTQVLC